MTIKQVITQLKSQGYTVEAYKRKDGGYLIKSINGQKFKGAAGNEMARLLVGESLSQRREKQLKSITPKAKTKASKTRRATKPKKPPLPADLQKEIRRTQRKLRESPTKIGGTVTTANIRYIFETQGKEQAMASLQKAQAYAAGIAYAENVQVLINRIAAVLAFTQDGQARTNLQNAIDLLNSKIGTLKDEAIWPIYEELYEYEKTYKYVGEEYASAIFLQKIRDLAK